MSANRNAKGDRMRTGYRTASRAGGALAGLALAGLALAMAGCGEQHKAPQPTASASPAASASPPQASIMRPGIETPTLAPPPIQPLDVAIGFPAGGAKLDPAALAELAKLVASPQVAQGGAITLGAHTDSQGSDDANLSASKRRGQAVLDWLVDHGIAKQRITLVAFGEQNPVAPNALPDGTPDEAGRAKNRRVEVHVAVAQAAPDEQREQTLVEEIEQNSEGKPPARHPSAQQPSASDAPATPR